MKYATLLAITLLMFACDQKPKTPATPPKATSKTAKKTAPEASSKTTPKPESKTTPKATTLTIPKTGKSFKPPVAKSKIPQGAYFCDMGTVHYARMDKGDGKCPLCGMVLVQQGTKANTKDDKPTNHDHHNHQH